jgi:hypothetical protein
MITKVTVFRDMMPFSLADRYQFFFLEESHVFLFSLELLIFSPEDEGAARPTESWKTLYQTTRHHTLLDSKYLMKLTFSLSLLSFRLRNFYQHCFPKGSTL